jgi:trigger factor
VLALVTMDIKITSQTETEIKLTITLNEAELKTVCEHVYDELRPKVKVAGFRPGKAPNSIVEREIGSSTVQGEVIEHAVQDTYQGYTRTKFTDRIVPEGQC